jgi:Arc/MetJ-type ribon-helix-helix transcriptional regulator
VYELVDEGVGESRSAVIRQGVHHLADAVHRARVGAAIADSYREHPQTSDDDDLAMASAIALTEAEPW